MTLFLDSFFSFKKLVCHGTEKVTCEKMSFEIENSSTNCIVVRMHYFVCVFSYGGLCGVHNLNNNERRRVFSPSVTTTKHLNSNGFKDSQELSSSDLNEWLLDGLRNIPSPPAPIQWNIVHPSDSDSEDEIPESPDKK